MPSLATGAGSAGRCICQLPTCHIDFFEPSPGGHFKMTLTFASHPGKSSSDTDEIDGRFVELVPDERVVQAITS